MMHPRNYELDSRGRYDILTAPGRLKIQQSRHSKPIISPPTVKYEVRGCHAAREPPIPSPHNTHALAIRDSKKRICIVYISISFTIHIKFTAYLFLHRIPNFNGYKKLSTTKCRYQFTLNTKI